MTKRNRNLAAALLTAATVAAALLSQRSIHLPWWSFENGTNRQTLYWTPDGGPYHVEFGEISPPCNEDDTGCWTAWWIEGYYVNGQQLSRPEVKLLSGTLVDPERVRSGNQVAQWFTFWRPHVGGLMLRQPAVPGQDYELSAFGHSWYSNCSYWQFVHWSYPLDYDCSTALTWAHDYLSVGIDPYGGDNPFASWVVWSDEREIYGTYSDDPLMARARAQGDTVTLWLRSRALWGLKHADNYWDDVAFGPRWVYWYPLMVGGVNSARD